MPHNLWQTITWLVSILLAAWVIYLIYEVALHVNAWPFS